MRLAVCCLCSAVVLLVSLPVRGQNPAAAAAKQTKLYTDLRDYGIVGAGSRRVDQAAALQAAIDATPDGGEIRCAPGIVVYVSRMNVIQRSSLRFVAAGSGYIGGSCSLYYIGPDGGTLLNLDSSYDVRFDGWSFFGYDGENRNAGAKYVVNISKSTSGARGKGVNSSHHTFQNGAIQTGTAKPDAVGVMIGGDVYGDNSEHMRFEDMMFTGYYVATPGGGNYHGNGGWTLYGTAIVINHTNVIGTEIIRPGFFGLDRFITGQGGWFVIRDPRGGFVNVFSYGSGGDIYNADFEGVCQIVVAPQGAWMSAKGFIRAEVGGGLGPECGTDSHPFFQITGGGYLDLDYPFLTDWAAPGGGWIIARNDGNQQATLELHRGVAYRGVPPWLTSFKVFRWFTQDLGEISGGNGLSGPSSTPGLNLSEPNGLVRMGLNLVPANGSGFFAGAQAGNMVLGRGEIELAGVSTPNPPALTLGAGKPGTQHLTIALVARNSSGARSLMSNPTYLNTAPNHLDGSNYLTVGDSSLPPGASSYDILHFCSGGTITALASGVSLPHNITANPACPGTYIRPTYNETSALNLRAPIGLKLLGPLLSFADNAYDIGSAGSNRPRTGYFATSVVTPKLVGISDTSEVSNLNAGRWHGKAAIDFNGTLDFPAIPSGSCVERTLSVAGAGPGDAVAPAWPASLSSGLLGTMYVSAANTVKVRLCNLGGPASTPPSMTLGGRVIK